MRSLFVKAVRSSSLAGGKYPAYENTYVIAYYITYDILGWYNIKQHTATASCIDIPPTSPLCGTGKSSRAADMSGPSMVERSWSSWIKRSKGSVGIAPAGPPAQQPSPPKSSKSWGSGGPKSPSSPSESMSRGIRPVINGILSKVLDSYHLFLYDNRLTLKYMMSYVSLVHTCCYILYYIV